MSDDVAARRAAHFEALYRANPDPWRYRTSSYEQRKYQATIDALPGRRFRAALEVGCSIGVLTGMIAERAEEVTGIDLSAEAIRLARAHLRNISHVKLLHGTVPRDWPPGPFDLMILSEVVYYLTAAEIGELSREIARTARPGAHCVLVNWTGPTGSPWRGPQAAQALIAALSSARTVTSQDRTDQGEYVMDHLIL
ncbi:methyltransferase domain-containing protein [Paracoccus pantotrophus]|uniref:Methyltransferase domain-containing protein n=1 Tax=Paracoccus pantotrophus TaxID=82367 RepID=A0A7H9BZA0_PARPN|nr:MULTISPECIES: class I SAM-dependent methyltransferase [Paracoccus]QLH16105.1 methyltransferase domain-containing protein [Paracoccus pantotrophus]UFM65953.1 nodulation S family protein [Paracoccus sp. MA]